MSDILIDQIRSFSELEWLAVVASLIYVVLAIKNNVWCFLFAFISSLSWAYVVFDNYSLGFDALLQLFYGLMAIVGVYLWTHRQEGVVLKISSISLSSHLLIIILTSIFSVLSAYLLSNYVPSISMPYLDALTTGFSIAGTILIIYRKIWSWIYLLICDLIYAFYIYPKQGAYLFALLMIIYSIMAIIGFLEWHKQKAYLDVV